MMRTVFSVLVLVAAPVADALTVQKRASHKYIQRLAHDEPIPDGWRLATVDDAQRQAACFSLVLRPSNLRQKRDKAGLAGECMVISSNNGNPFVSSPIRIERRKPQPDLCTCKVAVRFNEGEVLKRERVEHVVSRLRKLCEYSILTYSAISISPLFSKGLFFDFFLSVIYVYMPIVLRSEWIRHRGSI